MKLISNYNKKVFSLNKTLYSILMFIVIILETAAVSIIPSLIDGKYENMVAKFTAEGVFSGGPNGEFNLTIAGSSNALKGKLKNGKAIIFENGLIIPIEDTKAFEGWTE